MKTAMRNQEATAEIFWTAFKALRKGERETVVRRLLDDREFREDLADIAVIEARKDEPSRPLENYLAERKRHRRASLKKTDHPRI